MSDEKELRRAFPPKRDLILWWLVNVSASFFLSGAHNVFFFVSDLRTPVIHFLHYFSTTLFLFVFYILGLFPKQQAFPSKEFLMPVGAKFLETFLSSIVHAQNRTGGLYLLRIFDFLTTLTILKFAQKFQLSGAERPANHHMIWIGLSASLSWLEFGQMEYTWFSLICSPLLPISRAFSILTLWNCAQKLRPQSMDFFSMQYCALSSLALAIPALFSFLSRSVEVSASWESIDWVLLYLSPIFMSSLVYSELWFLLVAGPKSLQIADHSKYLAASIGQWIIQNMAHPSILALVGKILFGASAYRMIAHRFS
ncbi:unnamed protein product, partial [Mesorhabditis belari]|uniref:Uncharacterized protein n=1 Tax=Mesorhabditis belari TaxID=2138241 RepID=A0AAF3EVQ8_9BILA